MSQSAVLYISMWGHGRGHTLRAEKNKMLHSWHYKRSGSSKRSPLPYSHSLQYWHLVFLWSFALIKKRKTTVTKAAIQVCLWAVRVSVLHSFKMCACLCLCVYTPRYQDILMNSSGAYHKVMSWKSYFVTVLSLPGQNSFWEVLDHHVKEWPGWWSPRPGVEVSLCKMKRSLSCSFRFKWHIFQILDNMKC